MHIFLRLVIRIVTNFGYQFLKMLLPYISALEHVIGLHVVIVGASRLEKIKSDKCY